MTVMRRPSCLYLVSSDPGLFPLTSRLSLILHAHTRPHPSSASPLKSKLPNPKRNDCSTELLDATADRTVRPSSHGAIEPDSMHLCAA